ncbi:tyrosine-type recombinase/integrase [uncultured Shimia sp.]|uniref:tyrosine-type recombinase/integrase n=1 Tax=uncultured Shimia sp. TaxID=573152 RepID=UPI0026273429|nr:tyrosine-type recombinase/integrase [uncultured Shimia sp.]
MPEEFERETERFQTAVKLLEAPAQSRQELIEEYQRRSEIAFAASTRRNYRQIIANFKSWCQEHGHDSKPPVAPRIVAEYVEYQGGKIRPNTIETRLWAISEYHNANFCASPTRHRLVELALKGVKRTYGASTNQVPPLCKREVLDAIEKLGQSRLETRDKATLWIASDSWCRASEIVAFKVKDVNMQEDGSSLLFIERSKTDQFGERAYAYLSPAGTRAVFEWIKMAELKLNDPILTKSQKGGKRTPLDPATISRIFQRCTGRKDVSAHSTRVGAVHDAFRLGCDLSSIMVAGRWRSPEMPAR